MNYKSYAEFNRINSIIELFNQLYFKGTASFEFPSNPKIEQPGVVRSWKFLVKDESVQIKNEADYYINYDQPSRQFVKGLYSLEATDLKEKIAKMLLMILYSAEIGFVFDDNNYNNLNAAKLKEGEKNLTAINNLYNILDSMIDDALFVIEEHSYKIHEADWISFMLDRLLQLTIPPLKENLNYKVIRDNLYEKLQKLNKTYLINHRGIGVDYRNPDPEVPKF